MVDGECALLPPQRQIRYLIATPHIRFDIFKHQVVTSVNEVAKQISLGVCAL